MSNEFYTFFFFQEFIKNIWAPKILCTKDSKIDQTIKKINTDKNIRRRELYRLMSTEKKKALLAHQRARRAELKRQ